MKTVRDASETASGGIPRWVDRPIGRWRFLHFTVWCVLSSHLVAQDPGRDEIHDLQDYVVDAVSSEQKVSPLARFVSSVTGRAQSVLDIPRSVSVVTAALLSDRNADSLEEIVPFAPSASAPNNYGNATTPLIRGDVSEFFVNGQRRSANQFGFDPSFNAVESLDIVRGPAPVVFGPGFYSGGYVNYITKKPRLDEHATVLSVRMGSWLPTWDSYFDGFIRIDHNQPLVEDRLALRVSYEAGENDTIYKESGGRDDGQDLFVALAWRPHERFSLELNAQYAWQASPQLLGSNRPYDGLIRNNLYLTGEARDSLNVAGDGFSLRTTVTGTVELDSDRTLLSEGDFSNANIVMGQAIARWRLRSELTLTNRMLVEHINRRRRHEFSYTEYVTQFTFEDRIELEFSPSWFGLKQDAIGGLSVRYEETEVYMNWFDYYPYAYDITRGRRFRAEDWFGSCRWGLCGQEGPGGWIFYGAQDGITETTHSKVWNPAVFWQHEIHLGERISFLYGVRGNAYFADVTDPLPPLGVTEPWSDRHDFYNGNFHGSLIYRASDGVTVYGTYNRTHAVDGGSGGGGIKLTGGSLEEEDFRVRSELWEGGLRFSAFDGEIFGSGTVFRQERFRSELGGGRSGILVAGAELEMVYQPDEQLYILGNFTYTDGHYRDASPFILGGADLNSLYDIPVAPPADTGLIDSSGQVVPGDYRITGLSRFVFRGGLAYNWKSGWGFQFWGDVRSPQNGNILAQYTIPTQFSLNATVVYRRPSWEANLSFINLTDETNWVHNGDDFGSVAFIGRELPFRINLHLKYRF